MDTNEAPALRCKYVYYIYSGCPHQPMSEVEEVQELLREYPPPQKKNPFVEKSRPWDTKWRKRKR
jgi:predicted aconitase